MHAIPLRARRFGTVVAATFWSVTLGVATAQTAVTPSGAGTAEDPYLISQLGHLVWMGESVASSAGKHYRLTQDIEAAETAGWNDAGTDEGVKEGFRPIGGDSSSGGAAFGGVFDGQGHAIRNLTVNRAVDEQLAGLFGSVGSGGRVEDLGMEGGAIAGFFAGGLAAVNSGTITVCRATGRVSAGLDGGAAGGLIGFNDGTLAECSASGPVSAGLEDGAIPAVYYVGGLVGLSEGMIAACFATGPVNAGMAVNWAYEVGAAGGLVGSNDGGAVTACSASGRVSSNGNSGGLVGENRNGTITECHASGAVIAAQSVFFMYGGAGGLVAANYGPITACYATGPVTADTESLAGGLVAVNYGPITACYATGPVSAGTRGYVGGLAGYNKNGTITACYATGPVSAGVGGYAGGLAGINAGTITACYANGLVSAGTGGSVGGLAALNFVGTVGSSYWDMDTSGQPTSAGGTGATTAAMKQQATFAGWDFGAVWAMEAASYPYLQWAPSPFALSLSARGPGGASASPAQAGYAAGATVTLTATCDVSRAEFVMWSGAVADPTARVTTVTMDIHRSVVAVFRSARGLSSIAEVQRIGNDPDYTLDGRYWLTQDIEAAETADWNDAGTDGSVKEGFRPIGGDLSSAGAPFVGVFDGQGHVIRNLTVNRTGEGQLAGLFGYLGSGGRIEHVGLEGGAIAGHNAGGLVAMNFFGTIAECHATTPVAGMDGTGDTGGLVAYNHGAITECYASGPVSAGKGGYNDAGGLVGYNRGTITACYATGPVSAGTGSAANVGGLAGINTGTITACYANGSVIAGTGGRAGGLVGYNNSGTVGSSYWDMEASGQPTSAGGTGATTAAMKQQATFAGWDFGAVWAIDATRNDGYPYLRVFSGGGVVLPAGVAPGERATYEQWVLDHASAWGTGDFGGVPLADFETAYLLDEKPAAGLAATCQLRFDAIAVRTASIMVSLGLDVGGAGKQGAINGWVVVEGRANPAGAWQPVASQAPGDAKMLFAGGTADAAFATPDGDFLFRARIALNAPEGAGIVALAQVLPGGVVLPPGVDGGDREDYEQWVLAHAASWGTVDFGDVPLADFETAYLLDEKPAAGLAATCQLRFDAIAVRTASIAVTLGLEVGGAGKQGAINGWVVVEGRASPAGAWQPVASQAPGDAKMLFAGGTADAAFATPDGHFFFRAKIAKSVPDGVGIVALTQVPPAASSCQPVRPAETARITGSGRAPQQPRMGTAVADHR